MSVTEDTYPPSDNLLTNDLPAKKKSGKYLALLTAKIIFTIGALWFVLAQAELDILRKHFLDIQPLHILLAFLALNASQIISGMRMQHYFSSAGHIFPRKFCLKLYYVGAFFNVILPGGISGDGYKAWLLKRNFEIPALRSIRLILSERANGLLFLLLYTIIFTGFGQNIFGDYNIPLLIGLAIITIISYFTSVRYILKESLKTAFRACRFSIFSQGFIALCAFILLMDIYNGDYHLEYIALFMLSCVVAIIPISIGGAGMRELTFFYGAPFFNISIEMGIALSLLFFGIHVATSLVGVIFWNKVTKTHPARKAEK